MSTNEQIIKKFITETATRKWTDAQIQALSPKLRLELSRYAERDGKPITHCSAEIQDLIKKRGFSPADGRAALAMLQDKTINPMTQSNSEWVLSKGGSEVFTPTTSTLYMLNGEKVSRPLTPIPSNPKMLDNYKNLDVLTALIGTFVAHTDGQWARANEQAWVKVFPSLRASGVGEVADLLAVILNENEMWTSLSQTSKAAVTGRNGAVFIRNALNSLSQVLYNHLNTVLMAEAFGVIEYDKVSNEWYVCLNEDGNESVPLKVYETKAKTELDKAFSKKYPCVLLYNGGWVPDARLPPVDPTQTTSILLARQKSVDVTKGDSCIPSLLAKSQAFCGLTNETAKVLYFMIGATLECWRRGKVVNIRLRQDGDITPLYCALTYWQERAKKDEMFAAMTTTDSWFYFLPAGRNSHLNVAPAIKELILYNHQAAAVAIAYLNDGIKTKTEKAADPVNHDAASYYVLPPDLPTEYIVKGPIYGMAFFPNDDALKRVAMKGTSKDPPGKQYNGVRVYAHGNAMDFIGIASTLENLSLVGSELVGKATMVFVEIPLKEYTTRKAWYERVVADINMLYKSVFNPRVGFSPLCNLLVITKGKVTMLQSLEDDATVMGYQGKVFVRAGVAKRKLVIPGEQHENTAMKVPLQDTPSKHIRGAPRSSFEPEPEKVQAPVRRIVKVMKEPEPEPEPEEGDEDAEEDAEKEEGEEAGETSPEEGQEEGQVEGVEEEEDDGCVPHNLNDD